MQHRWLILLAPVVCSAGAGAQPSRIGGTLVVTNKTPSTATIIDVETGAVRATLPTGNGPHEIVMSRWLEKAEGDVYVIADVSAMKKVLSIKQILILKHMRHPRLTHAMTVGLKLNPMARFIVPLVAHTVGLEYKDFATREEARAYILETLGV